MFLNKRDANFIQNLAGATSSKESVWVGSKMEEKISEVGDDVMKYNGFLTWIVLLKKLFVIITKNINKVDVINNCNRILVCGRSFNFILNIKVLI